MKIQDYVNKIEIPFSWCKELFRAKREEQRSVFLIYGNIHDFVFDKNNPPDIPGDLEEWSLAEFLFHLVNHRHIVLYYSLHTGIECRQTGGSRSTSTQVSLRRPDWGDLVEEIGKSPYPLQIRVDQIPLQYSRSPEQAIPLLTRVLTTDLQIDISNTQRRKGVAHNLEQSLSIALIIDYVHHLAPAPGGTFPSHSVPEVVEALQRWSTDHRLVMNNHIVIMLTPEVSAVHPELRSSDSRIKVITIPRPDREERKAFIQWLAKSKDFEHVKSSLDIEELANRTAGMNYRELRDFIKGIAVINSSSQNVDIWRQLKERRNEIIVRESGGLLEPKESQYTLKDVAGYKYVQQYIGNILPRLRTGQADVTGLLFAGPPGTGKSFYATALAGEAGVNVVVMRNLRSMWLGESERNLERVLAVARSLAPVVIFVDEIDQAFTNRRGPNLDSGVDQRLLGRLLEFMDDRENRGKVIWIAASNRPDLLDEALLSRFKLRIPFLLPDYDTCVELLRDRLPQQGQDRFLWYNWEEHLFDLIREQIVGHYSGRELETIVRYAVWMAECSQDYYQMPHKWEAYRQEYERFGSSVPPDASPIREENGFRYINAWYLEHAIQNAGIGHNTDEYYRQSLLALEMIPFESHELIRAIRDVFPGDTAEKIIHNDKLDKQAIRRLLSRYENSRY